MTYLSANLPAATRAVVQMSHEFPLGPISKADEQELIQFIELCNDCGATGFHLEQTTTQCCNPFCIEESTGTCSKCGEGTCDNHQEHGLCEMCWVRKYERGEL